jgi:hypothetical protein
MAKYDYTGGGIGDRPSTVQRDIEDIRAGRTPGAEQRDMLRKGIIGGIQGGLLGLSGYLKSKESGPSGDHDGEVEAENVAPSLKLPDYDGSNVKADRETYIPSWLSDHPDVQDAAARADANIKLNGYASKNAFGGYHTPDGADEAASNASSQAADTQTSQELMKQAGGMGRSLPRKTWGVD